jgi:hypothetical protein
MMKMAKVLVFLTMLWLAGCGGSGSGVQPPTETPPRPPGPPQGVGAGDVTPPTPPQPDAN